MLNLQPLAMRRDYESERARPITVKKERCNILHVLGKESDLADQEAIPVR